jgi:translocation and assembly module TamA
VRRALVAALVSTAISLVIAAPGLALAAEPKAQVQGELDRGLRAAIQRAVGVSKAKPESRVDARRRAREAGESAIAVLRSEGYYDYVIETDVGEGDTPAAIVRITPGPRSIIGKVVVTWDGPSPDPATAMAATKALALASGAPGRSADVLAAEGRVEATLRTRGYADAATHPRQVVVDHIAHTLTPTYHFSAGELVHLGGLNVVSQGRTKQSWIASLAPWKKGDVYDPAKVAKLEQRLRDAGVFNSVTVALAPADQSAGGLRPVVVSLGDRPPHTIELGAGYSSGSYPTTQTGAGIEYSTGGGGAGIDAKWILYNRLGQADSITVTGRLAQIQQKLDGELDLPDWKRADQILRVGADVFADDTNAYDDDGIGARASVERHYTKTTYITYGGAIDVVDTRESTAINANGIAVGENLKLAIFSLIGQFALDRSDDPLNPTRGWRATLEADPTYVTGDRMLPYLKLTGQVSGYLPLGQDASTVLAARVKLGSIVGGDIPDVPADRRFFAGGGGSVRGFNYQGIGPQLADGTPLGGVSLFETSFEVRQRLNGPLSLAGFVDAGSLGPTPAPDFSHPEVGVGVGVRYDLGFGPIRLDIATPVTRRKGDPLLQLYISIGQSF